MSDTEPKVLRVDWLERGLLAHSVTMTAAPRSRWATRWALAAAAASVLGSIALARGQREWAGLLAAAWVVCAGALAQAVVRAARVAPATKRRVLVQLEPATLQWSVITTERWNLRHQHDVALASVAGATASEGDQGVEVDVTLLDGTRGTIPLHGLPLDDARWLAARILEGRDAAIAPSEPPPTA